MSVVGRRGSTGGGWTWSRPPSRPRRPPSVPPFLPIAGVGVIGLFVGLALLGAWLWGTDDDAPVGVSGTPTPTPAVTATPLPTAAPTSVADSQGRLFGLAAWDGQRWRFGPPLEGATYREGEAVPFLLRIERASRGNTYFVTMRYDCDGFAFLTSSDRDHGSEPALASGGPESATPDTTLVIPDDTGTRADDSEGGSLSLWGGSFRGLTPIVPISLCTGEKGLTVGLTAAADTVHLMWAAEISRGASERDAPLRLAVQAAGAEELSIEIDPESVRSAQP